MTAAGKAVAPSQDTVASPVADVAWPRPLYGWYVVTVLMVSASFALLDRIAISLMVDPIKHDLGISDSQMGMLQGVAFAVSFSLFGLPVGYLLDRRKRIPLLGLGIMVWSFATIACGLARSYSGLFLARIAMGVGESTTTPAAASLIPDYFRPADRAKAMGVYMISGSLGQALGYLIGGVAIDTAKSLRAFAPALFGDLSNWQVTFLMIGAPGVLIAILILATIREPVRRERQRAVPASPAVVWAHIRANPGAYAAIMLGAMLNNLTIAAQVAWFPTLFARIHHWSGTQIGTTFAIIGFPCATFSAVSAGWLISWLGRRGRTDGPLLVMMGQPLVWAIFGPLKVLAPTPALAIAAHIPTAFVAIWSFTASITAFNEITPNEQRSQVVAASYLLTGLIAFSLGPLIIGVLNDRLFPGAHGIAWSLTWVYLSGGVAALAILAGCLKAFRGSVARRSWAAVA